ncbi:MAG: HlyD family efflux transporter periplasmic adaptor subunit [Fibrobacterota bacterium]
MKTLICTFPILVLAAILGGCGKGGDSGFLGSAVVEVRTWQPATTVQGLIMELTRDEGQRVAAGELLAVIDTVPYHLKRQEILATLADLSAQTLSKRAELEAGGSDLGGIKREYERIRGLVEKNSAPQQQADDLKTKVESSTQRLKSSELALLGLSARRDALSAQLSQSTDQLARCRVRAMANGLVLTRYKNIGEVAGAGQPLYEIGRYDTVQIDFFVPEPLLASLSAGQTVRVRTDTPDGKGAFHPAIITWVSPDAEFAPKNVQTREARTELVFRVRAQAPNPEGGLKRGLPVEVWH